MRVVVAKKNREKRCVINNESSNKCVIIKFFLETENEEHKINSRRDETTSSTRDTQTRTAEPVEILYTIQRLEIKERTNACMY